MKTIDIQALDLQHNWHPCSQMKDYETFKPLVIKRARGSYIELDDGHTLIDAVSSWWCKSLGHNHPVLKQALLNQAEQFEHVIFANTTNEVIAKLSQTLANLLPGLNKVFYAGDGSCAVEIAMKMSLHYRVLRGQRQKRQFAALRHAYHGETAATLSVSDVGIYRDPYASMMFDPIIIDPLYVSGRQDVHWYAAEQHWFQVESQLNQHRDSLTAIMVEPIVQGAGGMRIYSQDFLARLAAYAKAHDIHLIADEIMTGIGRTGKMLACEHANIVPDFICLSKGLTSGWLPFSAVLTTQAIYDEFYDDYETGKSFLHSHTFSGNALGAAVALAAMQVIQSERIVERAECLQDKMLALFNDIAQQTGRIENIRGIGAVIAADLVCQPHETRLGFELYQKAIKLGALLRPLGNTIYWMPPLNITDDTLYELHQITLNTVKLR